MSKCKHFFRDNNSVQCYLGHRNSLKGLLYIYLSLTSRHLFLGEIPFYIKDFVVQKLYFLEESHVSESPRTKAVMKTTNTFANIRGILEKGVEDGVFPGAVLLVGRDGGILFHEAAGYKSSKGIKNADLQLMEVGTVFDIAQLTGVVVTATLVMKLIEAGKLSLEDKVIRFLQTFGVHNKSSITIGQLLSHTAGLPASIPFYEDLLRENAGPRLGIVTSRGARDQVYGLIQRLALKYEPGTRQMYSEIGLILLGQLIEMLTGLSLDKAFMKNVAQPLGLKSTSYVDLSMIKRRGIHPVTDLIAPTEDCSLRKRVMCGEVQDENAWAIGGIAGHAGLFASAGDLHKFASELIAAYRSNSTFLTRKVVARFWNGVEGVEGSWKYGWDSPCAENGLEHSGLSERAVGCCGFTGCSLWIEPDSGVDIILLTNRIHPTRANRKIFSFRSELHQAVLQTLG